MGVAVAKQPRDREHVEEVKPTEAPKAPVPKGKPTSTKLYELHAKKLSELAREEELEGGAAEAFDKHFGPMLDNILIAAKAARLKKLREEAGSCSRGEKEKIEKETSELRREAVHLREENERLAEKVNGLLSERDAIQLKVEAMLDAMTIIDAEVAEAVGR
jgi:chromosome segregation ATPase